MAIVAIVCAALLNRLNGDQLTCTPEECLDYQQRPFKLVGQYMKSKIIANE